MKYRCCYTWVSISRLTAYVSMVEMQDMHGICNIFAGCRLLAKQWLVL